MTKITRKGPVNNKRKKKHEKNTHLLRSIVARRDFKNITIKRHVNSFLHFPNETTGFASMTQHSRIENQKQYSKNNG
jgi:hypothetical protein